MPSCPRQQNWLRRDCALIACVAIRYLFTMKRRRFVQSVAAAGSLPLFNISGTKASGQIIGANERINIGVCGIRGRGSSHLGGWIDADNVTVTTLVDIDQTQFEPRQRQLRDKNQPEAAHTHDDIRRALDDKDLDAISIATCNHTHALNTVWACQAGKDVYVEKPMSHNVWEGRKCIEAARKYGRMVQHGTQQRSSQGRANEIAAVKSGKYGKLLVSKGYCCKPRWSIGYKEPGAPPAHLNFDVWLGPAPEQPYHANLVHYNWHWFWDFGNGDTGNQGVHEMDVARWAIDGATMPNQVWSLGGRLGYDDQGETPNMQLSGYQYGDVLLHDKDDYKKAGFGRQVSNEYYTTEGVIRGNKFYADGKGEGEAVSGGEPEQVTPGGAFGSFIAACRSRDIADLNADVEHGHYSSALCHLGNIAQRVGKPASFGDGTPKSVTGDNRQSVEAFAKIKANLEFAGVDLDATKYQLSSVLDFDPASERFTNSDAANALLSRKYREPYVIPEAV